MVGVMAEQPVASRQAVRARRHLYLAATVGVLILVAVVISTLGDAQWQDSTYLCAFDLCGGAFHVLFRWRALGPGDSSYGTGSGFVWSRFNAATSIAMWKGYGVRPRGFIQPPWVNFTIPLWIPLVVSVMGAVWAYRHWKRMSRVGYCAACGYNLTGNVSGRCPECGRPISRGVRPVPADEQ